MHHWNRSILAAVLALLAGCDGSGHLAATDAGGDLAPRIDTRGVDAVPGDGIPEDVSRPPVGPSIVEILPLPLADYGPAFWLEAEASGDGMLEVSVRARDLSSMVGFAVQVTWDPALLELVEVAATAPVGGPDAVARGVAAGLGPGRLTMGVTRFPKEVDPWNPTPLGVDLPGNVEMGRFVLKPLAPGDAVLRFREGHRVARRPDHGAIPCAWAGLQVRIAGAGPAAGEVER
jgi:hypothetical protein